MIGFGIPVLDWIIWATGLCTLLANAAILVWIWVYRE